MKTSSRGRSRRSACLMIGMFVVPGIASHAEVAVVVEPGVSPSALRFAAIVDGSDPVPFVWSRISVGTNYAVLNETGDVNGDGPPTIVGNPAGVCLVAWAKHTPGGYDIVASRFDDNTWTTPEVLAGSSLDEFDPVLLQGPDGTIHLFYWEAGAVPRILHRTASADLATWSAPVAVSLATEPSCRPQAAFHDGVLRLVYEVHDYGYGQTPRQIVVARLDNGQFVREVVAISQNAEAIWPEIHSRAGVLWVDWEEAPGQMFWIRRDPVTGNWQTVQTAPYNTQMDRRFFVRGTIRDLALAP